METTPRLDLPYIMPSQAQKHVTHNEALKIIDGLLQPVVADRNLATAPPSPEEGDAHIVAQGATGAWTGRDNAIACFQDGAWQFLAPTVGWQAFDASAGERIVFDGTTWASPDAGGSKRAWFGVHTEADTTNRLAVSASSSLFTHEGGDHRLTTNKASAADTASHLFQTAYSGRAEIGLAGDDDFRLKVSPDGTRWKDALVADRDSGRVTFPGGVFHAESRQPLVQLLPCPDACRIWHIDTDRPATPRTYTLASVDGASVNLTEARVPEFFTDGMRKAVMIRIWNVSKSPAQSAWVTWNSSGDRISVSDAADVASWAAGETVQLGDPNPTGGNTLGMIAIDIGPFLKNSLGAAFPQKGVLVAGCAGGNGGDAGIEGSGTGAAGSLVGTASAPDGKSRCGEQTLFTPVRSPVSDANLVFLRESLGSATRLGPCSFRLLGVYV